MSEFDLGDITIGDDDEREDSVIELGSDVYLILGEDEYLEDEEGQIRISIDEMVKGMGVTEVPSLDLGYEFDEEFDDDSVSIDGVGIVVPQEEVKYGETRDGELLTEVHEANPNAYPYFAVCSKLYDTVNGQAVLREPATIETLARTYTDCEPNPIAIAAAVDRYKQLLTGALNGLISGLYNEAVHSGVLNYFRNSTGLKRTKKSDAITIIDEEIKYAIETLFVDKELSKSSGYNVRRNVKDTNGNLKEVDDGTIVSYITDLLIREGYLSSDIKSDVRQFASIRDNILKYIDDIFYDKDVATKISSVKVRDWFEETSLISNYLIYTLEYYPFLLQVEKVPLIKAERIVDGREVQSSSSGHSFRIVFQTNKGTVNVEDAYKVFTNFSDDYFIGGETGIPLLRKQVVGLTGYNYNDPDNSLNFSLHKMFSLGKYRGIKGSGGLTKLLVQCDCGNNLIRINPNIQFIIYYLSHSNDYQIQLIYNPIICPFCGRIVLLERDTLDIIENKIVNSLKQNSGESARFIIGRQYNYGFRLSPPTSVLFVEDDEQTEIIHEENDEDEEDLSYLTPKSYDDIDLIRHIKQYEDMLNKFRVRRKNNGVFDKDSLAYLTCNSLMEDYNVLKKQAVDSLLVNLSNDGIVVTMDDKLKESLLSFWDKDVITEEEYRINSEYFLQACNDKVEEGNELLTMDLFEDSGVVEDLKMSPKQLLMGRPLNERWNFLRLMCMRYLPSEKIDVNGTEEDWQLRYNEVGDKLRSLRTLDNIEAVIDSLYMNIDKIACGPITAFPVDYRKYTKFFSNERFVEWLDKASDLMLLTGLCDKIVRYVLKNSRDLAVFIKEQYDVVVLKKQFEKIMGRILGSVNESGEMVSSLNNLFYYRMFYKMDKDFANDMDRTEPVHRKAVINSHINKWKSEIEEYTNDVCTFDYFIPIIESINLLYTCYTDGNAELFYNCCVKLRDTVKRESPALLTTHNYGPFFRAIDVLCEVGETKGASECLREAIDDYHLDIITCKNIMRKIMDFDELASSAILEILFKYNKGMTFFEIYLTFILGIPVDSVSGKTKTIKDYISVEQSTDYDFQMFLLNMVYPIIDMNYTTEKDEDDEDATSYNSDFMLQHTIELVNNHYTELFTVIPDEYKSFIVKYLGEE